MAYYPFNGNFNDYSGRGHHGTANNGVTFGKDQWGNTNYAASFDGIDDWISVAASPDLSPGQQTTFAFRFLTNSTALQVLLSKSDYTGGSAPNNFQYQVGINGGSVLPNNGLFFSSSHTNTCVLMTALATNYGYGEEAYNNRWYCVVITFKNGVKKVYINGTLNSTTTITGTPNNNSIDSCSGGTLRIGTWWQKDTRYFNGLMDELRIWNRAINQQEIDSLCNLVVSLPPTDTVINNYAAVLGRDLCDNSFVVDTADHFAPGDTVLMIQMKGATIDSSNSATFGSVLSNNGAGNYEYNVVSAVAGNRITLRYRPQRSYDIPGGRVQFVRVPSFASYTINKDHTCLPWTGTKGGVFAIRVAGTLALNKNIDVSGKGFRGGQNSNFLGLTSCDRPDHYYSVASHDGGRKGEGIAEVSVERICGKGKLANGGGGGNGNGSGGAGGSNGGAGGLGGHQSGASTCDTSLAEGGIGGAALTYSAAANRIYFGGGGGCGHEHNGKADPGGNGGGIILIQAGSLAGNGMAIKANGANCVDKNALTSIGNIADGQGGGGAGGTIMFRVASYSGLVSVEAKGGNGGNVHIPVHHGPGGGGGGGAILFSSATLNPAYISTSAGTNGLVVSSGNSAHSALPGQSGLTVSSMPYAFPTAAFQPNILNINITDSDVSCLGRMMFGHITTTSTGIVGYEWHWQNITSTDPNPIFTFPGIGSYPVKLIVTDSNGCKDSLTKSIYVTYGRFAKAESDTSICDGGSAELRAFGGVKYVWSPSSTLSDPKSAVTTAKPKTTTTYVVVVTDSTGCVDRDSVQVTLLPGPAIEAYSEGDAISCDNSAVHLHARGAITYSWSPANFCDVSTSSSPIVTPDRTTLFTVTGTDERGCSSTDTITVFAAKDAPVFIPTAFTPNGDGRNDFFRPIVFCDFDLAEFRVFNRWGQCVFYGNSIKHHWNGMQNGTPAPMGVYYYFMRGKKVSTGEELFFKGDITLIR